MVNHGKFSSLSPCFFRRIMPHILEKGTLELPRNFTKKHWENFSKHAYLEVPTGAKSKMKMKKKSNGRARLHKGWKDFVKKYSIKDGYFLVFRYQGRSNFSVQIFDLSSEEIEYVKTSQKEEVDFDIKEEQCDDNHDDSRKLKSGKKSSSVEKNLQRENAVWSRNPHFSVSMKPAYVTNMTRTRYMHVPAKAKRFFHMKGKGDIFLSLKEENGKVWSTKYCVGPPPNYIARLGSGWREFSEENNLKEGDICTFELVSSIKMLFKVTISRKTDEDVGQRREKGPSIPDVVSLQETGNIKEVDFDIKEEESDDVDDKYKDMEMDYHSRKFTSGKNSSSVEKNSPHFSVIMKPAYVSKNCFMHIPASGTSFFHNKGKDDIFLSLKGGDGKVWSMKYYVAPPPYYIARITSGWRNFAKENNLKEGDICTFEPVSSIDMIFKVTISRETDEQIDNRRQKCSSVIPNVVSPRGTKRKRVSPVKEEPTAIACSETCFIVTVGKAQVQDSCRLNIPRAHSVINMGM